MFSEMPFSALCNDTNIVHLLQLIPKLLNFVPGSPDNLVLADYVTRPPVEDSAWSQRIVPC